MVTELQLRNRGRLLDALASLPVNFEWNFSTTFAPDEGCGSVGCAIGLAFHLHILDPYVRPDKADGDAPYELYRSIHRDEAAMADALGISENAAYEVFFTTDPYGKCYSRVTPADVAEALEQVIQEEDASS